MLHYLHCPRFTVADIIVTNRDLGNIIILAVLFINAPNYLVDFIPNWRLWDFDESVKYFYSLCRERS